MIDEPIIIHPFTCGCADCLTADPRRYVHDATDADMARHLRLIEDHERRHGIRPCRAQDC